MKCTAYELGTLKQYQYVEIFAKHKGEWLLCRHKDRQTWEIPGGHIDPGETPEEAAKRELTEETGALEFNIKPICDAWLCFEPHEPSQGERQGMIFYAEIKKLGPLPKHEMAEARPFKTLPEDLSQTTYPDYYRTIFPQVLTKLLTNHNTNNNLSISDLMQMQWALHNLNEEWRKAISPQHGSRHLFLMMEEIGELSSIIKKRGDVAIMDNPQVRAAFIEEASDILAYLTNTLLCYKISPSEWSQSIQQKNQKNLKRNWPTH